jgi:hypothetical protein
MSYEEEDTCHMRRIHVGHVNKPRLVWRKAKTVI